MTNDEVLELKKYLDDGDKFRQPQSCEVSDDVVSDDDLYQIDKEVEQEAAEVEKELEPLIVDRENRNNEEVLLYLLNNRDRLPPHEIERIETEFYLNNERIIYFVANKQATFSHMALDEVVDVGRLGFARAFERFDPRRGIKFTTFAIHCIRNEIMGVSKKEKMHFDNKQSMSDTRFNNKDGKDLLLEDTLADTVNPNPAEILEIQYRNAALRKIVDDLTPFEKYIIYTRFGLDRDRKHTQRDIARITSMSQANISKIEKSCLEKLHTMLQQTYYN